MAYGTIKVDTVTFTDGGIDKSVSISGLVQNPTFSGNVTVTGTVSGNTIQGQTISGVTVTGTTSTFATGSFVSLTGTTIQGTTASYTSGGFTSLTGVTTSGTTANFVSGVFSTQISGATVTGTTASFTSGVFANISGGTHTITSGVFAAGSAASPSISFTSDPNTGIYSPGADQLALSTSGTGRLFVDSSGRVGVGSAPSVGNGIHATINTNSYGTALVLQNANVNGWAAEMQFLGITTTDTQAKIGAIASGPGTNSGALAFYTANAGSYSERLRITSTGELKHFGGGTEGSPAVYFAGSAPSNSLYVEATTGHVGIGTSSPTANFQVNHTSTAPSLSSFAGSAATFRGSSTIRLSIGTYPDPDFTSWIQSADATGTAYPLLLQPLGSNVGIGTTNVDELLHVESDGATPKIKVESTLADSSPGFRVTNDARSYDIRIDGTNDNLQFYDATASQGRVAIDSSGRLLVGTSSDSGGALLQVNGNRIRVATAKTPSSASDTGTAGEICWDASYIYVCTATNTWKRAALSTW